MINEMHGLTLCESSHYLETVHEVHWPKPDTKQELAKADSVGDSFFAPFTLMAPLDEFVEAGDKDGA